MNPSILIAAALIIYAWKRGAAPGLPKIELPKLPADTSTGETKSNNKRTQYTYEQRNQPWRWTARPDYFKRPPLSPRAAEYWRELSEYWRRLRAIQIQLIDAETNTSTDDRDQEQLDYLRQQFSDLWQLIKDKTAIYTAVEDDYRERLALHFTRDEIRLAEIERRDQYLAKMKFGGAHSSFPRYDHALSIHTAVKTPGGGSGKGNKPGEGKIDQL